MDLPNPGPLLRPTLLAAGWTDDELRRLRRRGDLTAITGGAYVESSDPRLRRSEAKHTLLVVAAVPRVAPASTRPGPGDPAGCALAGCTSTPPRSVPRTSPTSLHPRRPGGRPASDGAVAGRAEVRRDGVPLGEVDLGWPEFTRCGRLLRPGQVPADVVVAEKVREDAILSGDLGMTRWIWPEIGDVTGVAKRLALR